jgi:hypothetical protein
MATGGAFALGPMLANFETPSRAKMLKVWGRRSSFNVGKVMWLIGLEHHRAAFCDHVMIALEELRGRLLDQ